MISIPDYFHSKFGEESGIISAPIGRHPKNRTKRTLISSGKEAHTSYEKIENNEGLSLLKVIIKTGRTHQIRVHLSSIGHPVYGDQMYSNNYKISKKRILLHSYRIKFFHPNIFEYLLFTKQKLL